MAFGRVARRVDIAVQDDQRAHSAGLRGDGSTDGVPEILRSVRIRQAGRALRGGENHRSGILIDEIDQERGFLQRVGPMSHDDAAQVGALPEHLSDSGRQPELYFRGHRGATDPAEVLGLDGDLVCQRGNQCEQVLGSKACRLVGSGIHSRRYGSAGGDQVHA